MQGGGIPAKATTKAPTELTTPADNPWYKTAFDSDYLERYAHRDRGEAEDLVGRLMAAHAIPAAGAVLDLCCGGGRHLVAMARRGVDVTGFDLSCPLLRTARLTIQSEGIPLGGLVRGDMRRLPFANGSFAGVTHFFTAFGYFDNDEENFQVFREVARILKPGGTYLFDFFNSTDVRAGLIHATDKRVSADGRRVEKYVRSNATAPVTVIESVRLFSAAELRNGLTNAGFVVEKEWGDYGLDKFDEDASPRWMALARRVWHPSGMR